MASPLPPTLVSDEAESHPSIVAHSLNHEELLPSDRASEQDSGEQEPQSTGDENAFRPVAVQYANELHGRRHQVYDGKAAHAQPLQAGARDVFHMRSRNRQNLALITPFITPNFSRNHPCSKDVQYRAGMPSQGAHLGRPDGNVHMGENDARVCVAQHFSDSDRRSAVDVTTPETPERVGSKRKWSNEESPDETDMKSPESPPLRLVTQTTQPPHTGFAHPQLYSRPPPVRPAQIRRGNAPKPRTRDNTKPVQHIAHHSDMLSQPLPDNQCDEAMIRSFRNHFHTKVTVLAAQYQAEKTEWQSEKTASHRIEQESQKQIQRLDQEKIALERTIEETKNKLARSVSKIGLLQTFVNGVGNDLESLKLGQNKLRATADEFKREAEMQRHERKELEKQNAALMTKSAQLQSGAMITCREIEKQLSVELASSAQMREQLSNQQDLLAREEQLRLQCEARLNSMSSIAERSQTVQQTTKSNTDTIIEKLSELPRCRENTDGISGISEILHKTQTAIEGLQSQNSIGVGEVSAVKSLVETLSDMNFDSTAQHEASMKSYFDECLESLKSYFCQQEQLTAERAANQETIAKLQRDFSLSEKHLSECNVQLSVLRAKEIELEGEKKDIQAKLSELQGEFNLTSDLGVQLQTANSTLQEKTAALDTTCTQLTNKADELRKLSKANETLQDELAALQQRLREVPIQNVDVEGLKAEFEQGKKDAVKSAKTQWAREAAKLAEDQSAERNNHLKRIEGLENKAQKAVHEKNSLMEELVTMRELQKEHYEIASAKQVDLDKAVDLAQKNADEIRTLRIDLKATRSLEQDTSRTLNEQLDSLRLEVEHHKATESSIDAKVESLQSKLVEQERKLCDAESDKQHVLKSLRAQLAEQRSEASKLQADSHQEINRLASQLADTREKSSEMHSSHQALVAELESWRSQARDWQTRHEQLETSHVKVQASHRRTIEEWQSRFQAAERAAEERVQKQEAASQFVLESTKEKGNKRLRDLQLELTAGLAAKDEELQKKIDQHAEFQAGVTSHWKEEQQKHNLLIHEKDAHIAKLIGQRDEAIAARARLHHSFAQTVQLTATGSPSLNELGRSVAKESTSVDELKQPSCAGTENLSKDYKSFAQTSLSTNSVVNVGRSTPILSSEESAPPQPMRPRKKVDRNTHTTVHDDAIPAPKALRALIDRRAHPKDTEKELWPVADESQKDETVRSSPPRAPLGRDTVVQESQQDPFDALDYAEATPDLPSTRSQPERGPIVEESQQAHTQPECSAMNRETQDQTCVSKRPVETSDYATALRMEAFAAPKAFAPIHEKDDLTQQYESEFFGGGGMMHPRMLDYDVALEKMQPTFPKQIAVPNTSLKLLRTNSNRSRGSVSVRRGAFGSSSPAFIQDTQVKRSEKIYQGSGSTKKRKVEIDTIEDYEVERRKRVPGVSTSSAAPAQGAIAHEQSQGDPSTLDSSQTQASSRMRTLGGGSARPKRGLKKTSQNDKYQKRFAQELESKRT